MKLSVKRRHYRQKSDRFDSQLQHDAFASLLIMFIALLKTAPSKSDYDRVISEDGKNSPRARQKTSYDHVENNG